MAVMWIARTLVSVSNCRMIFQLKKMMLQARYEIPKSKEDNACIDAMTTFMVDGHEFNMTETHEDSSDLGTKPSNSASPSTT